LNRGNRERNREIGKRGEVDYEELLGVE